MAAALIYSCAAVSVATAETRDIFLLYTGAVEGELEPCGCAPETDFGGVARRAGYLERHRQLPTPSLVVDGGNFVGEDSPQGRLKAETMMRAFAAMEYDGVGFAKSEGLFPRDFMTQLTEGSSLPFINAGDESKRALTVDKGGITINISRDPRARREGVVNLLLSETPLAELEGIEGWDIVLLSSGDTLETPQWKEGSVVVAGYPRGERLGVLLLTVNNKSEVVGFEHRWQLLGAEMEESDAVRALLKEYDEKVGTLLGGGYESVADAPFVGVEECAQCHQTYVDDWKKTDHSRAWSVLEEAGKAQDPECIRCHVVGFGEKGGFHRIETTPRLANVQCEVCHGPGAAHVKEFYKPMAEVSEATCLRCHTEKNSPEFDYSRYREAVDHKKMWED